MSVKQWKQVITITVVAIITILFILTIVFAIRSQYLKNIIKSEQCVILTEYDGLEREDLSGLLQYLEKIDANGNLTYQNRYPNLYVENEFQFMQDDEQKVCYLTFDDGPDVETTTKILDTLQQYDIKATFFVIYKDDENSNLLYKRIVEEGHTIAVHTASHDYNKIYSSVQAYLKDFNKMASHIEEITGVRPEIFRFPGGSINTYNMSIYQEIIAEMLRRGYVYYDWNVSSGDAAGAYVASDEIVENVVSGCTQQDDAIVLLHDGVGHSSTAEALPKIIEQLEKQGFCFASLDNSVEPWCFGY